MVNRGSVNSVVLRVREKKLDLARLKSNFKTSVQKRGELVSADTRCPEGVNQRRLIGVTQRHAANQHLVCACANMRQDDF